MFEFLFSNETIIFKVADIAVHATINWLGYNRIKKKKRGAVYPTEVFYPLYPLCIA